jgi:hypothetical protein
MAGALPSMGTVKRSNCWSTSRSARKKTAVESGAIAKLVTSPPAGSVMSDTAGPLPSIGAANSSNTPFAR